MTWKHFIFIFFVPFFVSCAMKEAQLKREKSAAAHHKLGIAYLKDKPPALQRAYIEFQKSVELDPQSRDSHYALGHVYFKQKSYPEAISSFKKVLAIDPDFSEGHNYLGRVYAFLGEFDKAITSYRAALNNARYATPEAPYWNMGLVYIRQKKYKDAVRELNNALNVNPTIVVVHNLLGEVYSKLNEPQKAISAYREAIRITPDDINAHYNLACVYRKNGSEALAEEEFNKVLALSPQLQEEKDFKKCLDPVESDPE
ncbi:MAG: tetratricopeptide repeat protein [Nitrospiria bacterium]